MYMENIDLELESEKHSLNNGLIPCECFFCILIKTTNIIYENPPEDPKQA